MIDLIAAVATVAFVAVMVGCTLAGSRTFGLEQRAGLLDRRNPALAAALRRAESFSDLSRSGFYAGETFSAVCTPSRASWIDGARVRAADSDLRVEPPEEALPVMPATVVALAGSEHVPQSKRSRHPSRRTEPQPAGGAKNSGHQPTASG
ncbi:hypothetical protein J7E25_07250 [Agromyces sp. ISL-38]|uniref:hypothetical protein n=1 Tax=Agromyces sp. ISL-38 TaxID=2819107 RepID=UPI001BE8E140|nr:hypothetical protein [Agromyces sp. ISL-38]MBT2498889.1 hypothetical protein [Agromyces sp. ISL-38]MBT2516425.1 hypothetical protein [Streptomyces sp. ISL-90]